MYVCQLFFQDFNLQGSYVYVVILAVGFASSYLFVVVFLLCVLLVQFIQCRKPQVLTHFLQHARKTIVLNDEKLMKQCFLFFRVSPFPPVTRGEESPWHVDGCLATGCT